MGKIIRLNENGLRNFVFRMLMEKREENQTLQLYRNIIKECRKSHFKEVKYFHPSGVSFPNGIGYQRGWFLKECKDNRNKFILSERVHPDQYGLANYKDGMIIFSTEVNAVTLDKNRIKNAIKQVFLSFRNRFFKDRILGKIISSYNKRSPEEDYIGAYSIGNSFRGRYVGDDGNIFNEKSTSIEINGLSSNALLRLAEFLCRVFKQETVLVKDFNNGKIYLADPIRVQSKPDFSKINQKSETEED